MRIKNRGLADVTMKKTVLTIFILITAASATSFSFDQKGKAALIDLSGSITPSQSVGLGGSGITPEQVRKLNKQAEREGADAIIYEINSGGGAVVASKEVYRAIEDVEVPTVCRLRDVAASGGYMISLGCDRTVADSATLTGSIGVKSSYIQYSGTLDRFGARYINISAGNMKEVGNPFMNISEKEKEFLQEKAGAIHRDFLNMVEEERNLTSTQVDKISSGAPYLGKEAENLNLVDKLGGRETAVNAAENMTGQELETFKAQDATGFNLMSLLTADLNIGNFLKFSSPFRAEWR